MIEVGDGDAYAVVRIEHTYVARANFGRTAVPDNCRVFLIPLVAGG